MLTAHLAIDLGAESGRAIVGTLDGERLVLDEVHRFTHRPVRWPSGLHWDLTGLWREVLEGVRRGVCFARERGVALTSLGVDTWGVDFGLIGASGELLVVPRCYRDERHERAFARIVGDLGAARLYEATGTQLMALNTLFQLAALHEAEPHLLARAERLLFMPDLVHFLLTGRAAVEATIASTSQMVDPRTGTWASALVEAAGLPTHLLGDLVAPGTTLGGVLPFVREATGAGDVSVVLPATHDTASAVAAVPASADGSWCFLSSGTWSLLGAELPAPWIDETAREAGFTNEGGVGGTVRFLTNLTGLWIVQECRRALAAEGTPHDYDRLTALASAAPPFRTLIDPAWPAFATPGDMPEKVARFARATGQPVPDGVGPLVRGALESLALSCRDALGRLESVLGRRFDVVHVVGGGARNALLNQMTADAMGRPLHIGPPEATAAGNVLVQAMGTGCVRDLAHARHIVRQGTPPVTVEPRDADAWDAADERFRALRATPVET